MLKFQKKYDKKFIRATHNGFSLLEILIALTLLVVTGTFAATKIFDAFEEGQINAAKIQMQGIASVMDDFRRKCRKYPTELQHLVSPPSTCKNAPPDGFFDRDEIPLDPWDSEYEYELIANGRKYVLQSFGVDAAPGGEGNDADICSYTGRIKECKE